MDNRNPDVPTSLAGESASEQATNNEVFGKSLILVQRSKEGDGQALNELLERYQERVLRIVRIKMGAKVRTSFESVDMVQETLAAAAMNLDSFEMNEPASLVRWLAVIAEHRIRNAADYVNAGKRDPSLQVPWATGETKDSGAPEPAGDSPGPQDDLLTRELEQQMDEAVSGLPDDWREVILLREFEGGSWEHVAHHMQRSIVAVQALHLRARQALSTQLREHGEDA
jgi:RNA polymerase sigma-70 factor (ECF subfamily)